MGQIGHVLTEVYGHLQYVLVRLRPSPFGATAAASGLPPPPMLYGTCCVVGTSSLSWEGDLLTYIDWYGVRVCIGANTLRRGQCLLLLFSTT